jgi:hypothetical protein
LNNPQTMPMSPNQSQTMPAGGLNFNSLGGFGGGGLGYAAAKAPAPPQVQLGGLQAPVPATAEGVLQSKTASQDSSKKQRSSTGEDSGVKYKHCTEGHLTQADAFKSLDGYMKSAGFNSFQSAFFSSLISSGFNSAQISHYTKQASAYFEDEVGSELAVGLEKLEKSAFGMSLLGKGLQRTGKYLGSKMLQSGGKAALKPGATVGSTLKDVASSGAKAVREFGNKSMKTRALDGAQGAIAGATNPNRNSDTPLSTRAFDTAAGFTGSMFSPAFRDMSRRANVGQTLGGGGAFVQGFSNPREQTIRNRLESGIDEVLNPDNKFRQYGYNTAAFLPQSAGRLPIRNGKTTGTYRPKLTSGIRYRESAPGWLEKFVTNPVAKQVGKAKDLAVKYPQVSVPAATVTAGTGGAAYVDQLHRNQNELNSVNEQIGKQRLENDTQYLENILSESPEGRGKPLTQEQEQELMDFDPNSPETFESEEAKQRYMQQQLGLLPKDSPSVATGSNPETDPNLNPFDQKSAPPSILPELTADMAVGTDDQPPQPSTIPAELPTAPEAAVPPAPEAAVPTAPEAAVPTAPEAAVPTAPDWLKDLLGPAPATFVAENKDWLLPLLLTVGGAGVGGLVDGKDGALLGGLLGAGGGAASSLGLIPGFDIGDILGFRNLTPSQQEALANIGGQQITQADKSGINAKIDAFSQDGLDSKELSQLQAIPGALGTATERPDFNALVADFMQSPEQSELKTNMKKLQDLGLFSGLVLPLLQKPVGTTEDLYGYDIAGMGLTETQAKKFIAAIEAAKPAG